MEYWSIAYAPPLYRVLSTTETAWFSIRMTDSYRQVHAMDAVTGRPGDDHRQQICRPTGYHREQSAPEDRGLPQRVGQRLPHHAGHRGAGYSQA